MSQIQYLQIVLFAAVAAIAFGLFTTNKILSLPKGTKKMIEISGAIQEGAKAYLDRQYKTIAIFSKLARGLMTRHIVETKAETIEALKTFNAERYAFDANLSTENKLVFTR